MTGWWGRQMVLGACVAVAAVGCTGSSGPEPAEPLESAEPLTTPAATDPPATTVDSVNDPVESEPSTTTTSTSTTSTTTTEPAPTTTTLEDLRREIEEDLNEGEQAFIQLGASPGDPDSIDSLDEFFAGRSLEAVRALYAGFASSGQFIVPGQTPSRIEVLEILDQNSDTIAIRRCRIDAAELRQATSTGDAVVDDTVIRYISVGEVVRDGERWKFNGGDNERIDEGLATCVL